MHYPEAGNVPIPFLLVLTNVIKAGYFLSELNNHFARQEFVSDVKIKYFCMKII